MYGVDRLGTPFIGGVSFSPDMDLDRETGVISCWLSSEEMVEVGEWALFDSVDCERKVLSPSLSVEV